MRTRRFRLNNLFSRREPLLAPLTRHLSLIARNQPGARLRIEDTLGLVFFLINLLLEIVCPELRGKPLNPSDLTIVVSAIALILAKEIAENFVADEGRWLEPQHPARPYGQVFQDWFPFVVILLMYYSLWGRATLLFTGDRDALLLSWDKRLFGIEPTIYLQRIISPPLTAWMQFSYAFHLYVLPIIATFIYVLRPRDRFRELMCGLVMICFIGTLGYMIVPAIGPMYTLHNVYTVPLSGPLAVFNRPIEFIDFARVRRDCFPSLHVGISVLVWFYARRNSKVFFWVLSPFIASCCFSTVYLRFHYAVDCLAGFILAPSCFLLANWLCERHQEITIRVLIPEAWAQRLGRALPGNPKPEGHR